MGITAHGLYWAQDFLTSSSRYLAKDQSELHMSSNVDNLTTSLVFPLGLICLFLSLRGSLGVLMMRAEAEGTTQSGSFCSEWSASL